MRNSNSQAKGLNDLNASKKSKLDVLSEWRTEFTERIKIDCKTRKQSFTYIDALDQKSYHKERDNCFIEAIKFLESNPLQNNDYTKYISCYVNEGRKLDDKYFRNNIEKLNHYYTKVDEAKAKGIHYNPFNKSSYENYVLFMILKLRGQYLIADDVIFNVQLIDNREYNPLTKIPSVLRGELPFDVKE